MGKKKGQKKGQKARKNSEKNASGKDGDNDTNSIPAVVAVRRARLPRACKKNNDSTERDLHFRSLGLQIRRVMGDGNCMFRAFSDQMEGKESNHRFYRDEVLKYIVAHRLDFETYHEQDEEKDFDERLKKLGKNGTFGGNECLVACARIFNKVIYVHQPEEKLTIELPPSPMADLKKLKQLHLVYSGGNHYDSLRRLNDCSNSAADVFLSSTVKSEDENRRGQSVDSGIVTEPLNLNESDDVKKDSSTSVVDGPIKDDVIVELSSNDQENYARTVLNHLDNSVDGYVSNTEDCNDDSTIVISETLSSLEVEESCQKLLDSDVPVTVVTRAKPPKPRNKPITAKERKSMKKKNKEQRKSQETDISNDHQKVQQSLDQVCKGVSELKIVRA